MRSTLSLLMLSLNLSLYLLTPSCATNSGGEDDSESASEDSSEPASAENSENEEPASAPTELAAHPAKPAHAPEPELAKADHPQMIAPPGAKLEVKPVAPAPKTPQQREIRYVAKDHTPIYKAMTDKAQVLRFVRQGETLVLTIKDKWGEIKPGMYVKMEALSQEIVFHKSNKNRWYR